MRELNISECQEISGGISFPSLAQATTFAKSYAGMALILATVAVGAAVVYSLLNAE